jgi:hypothetical protein
MLKSLVTLDLSDNLLSALPNEIGQLSSLKVGLFFCLVFPGQSHHLFESVFWLVETVSCCCWLFLFFFFFF